MRDPERIKPVLDALRALWLEFPDYRFGQLVMNLSRNEAGIIQDPWEWEEETWLRKIAEYRIKHGKA